MFETIVGNESVKALIRRLVAEKRVPQSLLFCGHEGIGKRLFALEIAKSLVCVEPNEGLPCGLCSACIRAVTFDLPTSGKKPDYETISFSEHPDVGMIVPNKRTIYVEAIRHLVEEAQFRPFEGRGRVFIIDEAEKLGLTHKAAANALLKTLEEPVPGCHLILITSQPSSLLQTIHSRCQKIRFASLQKKEVVDLLVSQHNFRPEDANLAAGFTGGSIGLTMDLDVAAFKETRESILAALSAVSGNDGLHRVLETSDLISNAKAKVDYSESLRITQSLIRDAMLERTGVNEDFVNDDIVEDIAKIFSGVSLDQMGEYMGIVEEVQRALRVNMNKRAGTDAMFIKMAGNQG